MATNFLAGVVPPRADPSVRVEAGSRRVIHSGVSILKISETLTIFVDDLTFSLRFSDDGGAHSFEGVNVGPKGMDITLKNFNNSLGTSMSATELGNINGEPLFLAIFVEDVGGKARVITYELMLGGTSG